jgi:hypothetical protein
MKIPQPTYVFNNVNYTLEQIIAFARAERIDTKLDCQRGYVWTEEQQQQLIDTLMNRERIPEFHVIKEVDENIFHYADGKQRITTIINFLNDELCWKKNQADKKFEILFKKKNKLYFSELPDNLQNMILSTQISLALYSNMTDSSTTKLFRKLNSGTALGEFQKGLAENISVKKYFLDKLMTHPVIKEIFTDSQIQRGDAEQALIRLMILMKNFDNNIPLECDLRPSSLPNFYTNLETASKEEELAWIHQLEEYQEKIKKYLDWLNTKDNLINLRLRSTYVFTFSLFFAYKENFNEKKLKKLYENLLKVGANEIVGSGADYNITNVKKYLKYVQNKVKEIN